MKQVGSSVPKAFFVLRDLVLGVLLGLWLCLGLGSALGAHDLPLFWLACMGVVVLVCFSALSTFVSMWLGRWPDRPREVEGSESKNRPECPPNF